MGLMVDLAVRGLLQPGLQPDSMILETCCAQEQQQQLNFT